MPADERLRQLFEHWQQSRQNGQPLSVDEVCRDSPDLAEKLRQLVRLAEIPGVAPNTIADPVPARPGFLELAPGVEPVPNYKLVSLLGRGSFGQVWKAIGPGGFSVAVKCVPLDEEADSAELRSLELMKDIHHANILPLFGAWQSADMLVVAMELAECSLLDRCNEYRRQGLPGIPRAELLEYTRDAAKGIDYLNEPRHTLFGKEGASIQHRDIKPQNLLLVGNSVKVADFGLAKFLEQNAGSNSGSMTAAYAAPECFKGKTSNRSDQYSLGVTYCQLRGGRLPFEGSHVGQIMLGHVGKPPDLSMVPEGERPALLRALAKEPEDRWPSCRGFVQALLATPEHQQALGKTPSAPISTLPTAVTTAPAIVSASQARLRRRRSEQIGAWTAAVLGLGMLVAGGWLGYEHYRNGTAMTPTRPGSAVAVLPSTPTQATLPEPTKLQTKPGPATTTKKVETPSTRKVDPTTKKIDPLPTKKEPTAREKAAAADRKGLSLLHEGKWDDALEAFDDAVRLDPENPVYFTHRGRARFNMREFKLAVADFDQSIKRNNTDAAAYAHRGRAYAELNEHNKAIDDFNEALRLEPKQANVLTSRGTSFAQLKNYAKALTDLTEATQLPDCPALAFRNRGLIFSEQGKYPEAIDDFNTAIKIDPEYAKAYGPRGWAHRQNKEPEKAMEDYTRALELDRKYSWAYNARGVLHAERGEWKQAIDDYSEAILLKADYLDAYENRARAYEQIGMKKEALADRNMVKKLEKEKRPEKR